MTSQTLTRTIIAILGALTLAGCAREHEIDRSEFQRISFSGGNVYRVEGEPFSGTLVYRDQDIVRARIQMSDGRPDGWFVMFDEDGAKISEGRRVWIEEKKESVFDGTFEAWNGDGQLVGRARYDEGIPLGAQQWCDDGQEKSEIEYADGEKRLEKTWDCGTGNMISESHFDEEGRRHGDIKVWTPEGVLLSHERYASGQLSGVSERWHQNGKPAKRGEYVAGKSVGLHETWDENGDLIEAGHFDTEGQRTGIWRNNFGARPNSIHYGPEGFIKPDVVSPFVRALVGDRASLETVEFYLGEGAVQASDALPADHQGNALANRFQFPVHQWTYPVVVANSAMLPALIRAGADINQVNSEGRSRLLQCASQFRSPDVARFRAGCIPSSLAETLALGARADIKDAGGNNALHLLLVDAGSADGTIFGRRSAQTAQARIDAISTLVKAGVDPNATNNEGHSPLTLALRARRADLAKAFLSAGAKADAPGPNETRAIHWLALQSGNRYELEEGFLGEMIPAMVSAGAPIEAPMDWDGEMVTIRDLAVRHGMVSTVRLIDESDRR